VLPLPPPDPRYLDGAPVAQIPDVVGKSRQRGPRHPAARGRTTSVETTDNNADRGTVVGQNPEGQRCRGNGVVVRQQRQRAGSPRRARRQRQRRLIGHHAGE
jgi:hypothetical protein